MSELANYWAKNGEHIDLIFLVKHTPFFDRSSKLKSVSEPHFSYDKNILSKFFYKIRLLFFLRKKYKELGTDVILSFGEGYNSFVLLSALKTKINVYISDRSNPKKTLSPSLKAFKKFLYPKAKGILAQTTFAKEILYEYTKHENILLVPNPIKIIPSIDLEKRNIILNVGRLVKEKDQLTLIRMFSKISNNDWELHIIGDGPLRNMLEDEITRLNLKESVKLLGSQKDLSKYFSESKIFAFTSISEGYPNALCEAMAFPLASISFDCDAGPRDIINNNVNGILIEKNDFKNYIFNLKKLMESEDLRKELTHNSIKIARKQSLPKISNKILNEFRKT